MSNEKDKKIISILSTGGTIASRVDYKTGGVYASLSSKEIIAQVPEIENIATIRAREVMQVMSEDIKPKDWKIIANEVVKEINSDADGVIITHGTDTMHYTSAALSFMLKNLKKPVVLVGAQRSSDRGSSDAFINLICASHFITKSDVAEVCIVMHENMNDDSCIAIRGCRARKMHTSRRDAFKPINDLPIARIYPDGKIEMISKNYRKREDDKPYVVLDDKLEEKVALIKMYPGVDSRIIDFYIKNGYKGFVIEATGLGHVSTIGKYSMLEKIKKAIAKNIPVVITSQCLYGRVHPTIYANLRKLSKIGCIFAEDMLPEVAYIKLMYALAHGNSSDEVKEIMLTNLANEISERTLE
ncbi:MAG: Glu-tRNA(Gln) amidotransferase subunit GatD [Candidatus Aenigmatarchaeota archaeon]